MASRALTLLVAESHQRSNMPGPEHQPAPPPPPEASAAASGSLRELANAFTARSEELVSLASLKVDERTMGLFADDVMGLEAAVSELESTLSSIQAVVAKERASLPRAAALLSACHSQSSKAQHVKENLPPYLAAMKKQQPHVSPEATADEGCKAEPKRAPGANRGGGAGAYNKGPGRPTSSAACVVAPRRFVTQAELGGAPGYMRGRLTLDKVNAAVEELAALAESVSKAASQKPRPSTPLGKQVLAMMQRLQADQKQTLKGRPWLLESCFKDGTHLKPDKSTRSLLTLLRHLGRLQEMRVTKGGSMATIYILLDGE